VSNVVGLRYLLDTNVLSALIRQPQGPVAATLARRGYGTVCTSIVVAAELRFGTRKLGSKALTGKVDDLLISLPPCPLTQGPITPTPRSDFSWSKPASPSVPTTC